MTDDEARKVAGVLAGVDGGCVVCVGRAARELEEVLPGRNWPALVAEVGGYWTEESLRSDD